MKNGDISNQSASSFGVRVDPIAKKKLLKSTEYFLDKEVVDFKIGRASCRERV